MKTIKIILLIFCTSVTLAQTNCVCCVKPHNQFDFWLGEWVVKDTAGNQVGESKISKIEDQCVLLEQWKGSQGGTGTSMNYFDKSDSTWNQLWLDNKASVLKLKGNIFNGSMILKSEMVSRNNKEPFYNQISWTLNNDGTVTQHWEICDKFGKPKKTLFKGLYYKKNN
ncbi:MAG: hypothetical protein AB7O73_04920 [Bacteroidia bacterium]